MATPLSGARKIRNTGPGGRTEPAAPTQIRWTYSGFVFTPDLDGPVDPRNLLRAIELTPANAGIENVGAHTLRHNAAVA